MAPVVIKKAIFLNGASFTSAGPGVNTNKITKGKKARKPKKSKKDTKGSLVMSREEQLKEINYLEAAVKKEEEEIARRRKKIEDLKKAMNEASITQGVEEITMES